MTKLKYSYQERNNFSFYLPCCQILLTLLLWLSMPTVGKTQTICHTPDQYNGVISSTSPHLMGNHTGPFYLRIYVHVIQDLNGNNGQSVAAVEQAIDILRNDFVDHNIYFIWEDNHINEIRTANYLSPSTAIFSVDNNSDGIDIYLYPDNAQEGGEAEAIVSSALYVSGTYWRYPYGSLITSRVISHEMGHVFGLFHTHRGSWVEPGSCAELVNGSNCHTCGDYICDTPADPFLDFNVDYQKCEWTESGTDANGDPYNPSTVNIMAYTHPGCMALFTAGQGQRMRNHIANEPVLRNTRLPELTIAGVSLSHVCWEVKDASGSTSISPAQLNAIAYGGYGDYTYFWETRVNGNWMPASGDLDNHQIKDPIIENAIQNNQLGLVEFRVTVIDESDQVKRRTISWERTNFHEEGPRLVVRNIIGDIGDEPTTSTWKSPDIWNRYDNVAQFVHYPPAITEDNYLFYRVRNLGCTATDGGDDLYFYWTESSTYIAWPGSFNFPSGDIANSMAATLPVLNPGQEHVGFVNFNNFNPNSNDGKLCLHARIYNVANQGVPQPWGLMTNSHGTVEKTSTHFSHNVFNFRNMTVRNTNITYFATDGEVITGSQFTNPGSTGGITINVGEEDVPEPCETNIIIRRSEPSYGILQTNLNLRAAEFNESIGEMRLHMDESLISKIQNNENIELVGLEIHQELNYATIGTFPDHNDHLSPQIGIYGLDFTNDENEYAVDFGFEVDNNNIYNLSEGYNVYEIVRQDRLCPYPEFVVSGKVSHTVVISSESPSVALATTVWNQSNKKPEEQKEIYNSKSINIKAYPNPFDDLINIEFNGDVSLIREIKAVNIIGKVVFEKKVIENSDTYTINSKEWANGVYVIKVLDDNNNILNTVVVVK